MVYFWYSRDHIFVIPSNQENPMTPLIILMYALFATSFSIGKYLVKESSPFMVLGLRFTIAGIILISYQALWLKRSLYIKKSHLLHYLQITLIGIYCAYSLRLWGFKYLTSSKSAFIYNASPFFSALYSYLFFHERMTLKQWIGLVIGFLGLIPILIHTSAVEHDMGEFLFISWPELVMLISVGLHSYGWIVIRKLVKHKNYPPMMVNGITMFFAGILGLATIPFDDFHMPSSLSSYIGWLFVAIIVSNIICYNLYGHLMKQFSATFLSFSGFLVPIFAAFYGWGFLGETITWHFYASSLIVFIGLYLFYQDELKKNLLYS